MEETKIVVGRRLKELRTRDKRSLQEVADAVGISKAHVWNLEKGESTNPSMSLLLKLAEYFRVGIADLVGEDPGGEQEDQEIVALYRDLKHLGPRDREIVQAMIERMRKDGGAKD